MTAPTPETDILIVGAGVLGLSTALHLAAKGARNVVVLDAGDPASGTSGAGAGFVGPWAAGYANFYDGPELALEDYGVAFYRDLSRRRPEIDCRTNGSMYVATTDAGLAAWIEPLADHPLAPVGTRSLDPSDVEQLTAGLVPATAVRGGMLHPAGIQISAGRVTRALATEARAAGVQIRSGVRVHGLIVEGGRVAGVSTTDGEIRARRVVLAAGAWTNTLLADVDQRLPLLTMVATRVVSPPSGVSPTIPTVMAPDLFGLWLREHRGGLTWGNGDGYAPLHQLDGDVGDPGRPNDPHLLDQLLRTLMPALTALIPNHDLSVGHWLQGMPIMTPDRFFVLGEVPDVDDLFVLTGDNESGVTHGPGLGRLLADVVLDGGSEHGDPARYAPSRFARDAFADEAAVQAAMPARR